MARKPDPEARERLLDIASRLFGEHGVRAVGLQQIIDECGCGKNLLYREFGSKDELVAAYLERSRADWAETVERAMRQAPGDAAAQLVALVRVVAEQAAEPGFRGCSLRNALIEFPDPGHPARRVITGHYTARRDFLRRLARQAGAREPDALGDRIGLLLDGVNADGALLGANGSAGSAPALAAELVAAAAGAP